jgi:hypothetical protein
MGNGNPSPGTATLAWREGLHASLFQEQKNQTNGSPIEIKYFFLLEKLLQLELLRSENILRDTNLRMHF